MPLTLGFDTSGPYVGTALVESGQVLAARYEDMARGQADHLMPMLEETLSDQGVVWSDIEQIGVGIKMQQGQILIMGRKSPH